MTSERLLFVSPQASVPAEGVPSIEPSIAVHVRLSVAGPIAAGAFSEAIAIEPPVICEVRPVRVADGEVGAGQADGEQSGSDEVRSSVAVEVDRDRLLASR